MMQRKPVQPDAVDQIMLSVDLSSISRKAKETGQNPGTLIIQEVSQKMEAAGLSGNSEADPAKDK